MSDGLLAELYNEAMAAQDDELFDALAAWDTISGHVLAELVATFPTIDGDDGHTLYEDDGPEALYATMAEEGGVWDGRWERYYEPRYLTKGGAVRAFLENRLREPYDELVAVLDDAGVDVDTESLLQCDDGTVIGPQEDEEPDREGVERGLRGARPLLGGGGGVDDDPNEAYEER